jgi:hypothetical protein
MNYPDFVSRKLAMIPPAGIDDRAVNVDHLFPHQADLARWAARRGRAAVFADTGLGKMRIELAWADAVSRTTKRDAIILSPLAVAPQIVIEGQRIGIEVTHALDDSDVRSGINVINYDRLHKIDPERFGAVVLDESSIIKHHDTKTLKALLDAFSRTPYRLPASATPAPNDWTELGTHAEFLGICTRSEMLAEYFVHDGGDTQTWRLKGHAKAAFWRWVASWGAMVRSPADLGHDASLYALPALNVHEHTVRSHRASEGMLFAMEAQTLSDRRDARKASLDERVRECAAIVNADHHPWVVWCDLNAESDALCRAIPGSVEIRGSDDTDTKERRLLDFAAGKTRVLVTKPSIAGWGLNWQHCARMAFVGVTDSFEAYYQAVRRCWRFGQSRPVDVHIFASEQEGAVVANLRRKESDAKRMAEELSRETLAAVQEEILGSKRDTNPYNATTSINVPSWLQSEAA